MQGHRNSFFYLALLGGLFSGCGNTAPSAAPEERYFSLEDYFQKEIERLSGERPQVEKTVAKNDEQERRSLSDLDWATELKVFLNSGINKPAWRDSYEVDSTAGSLIYRAADPELKIRFIRINRKPDGQTTGIVIRRSETNYLYTSEETLRYYPDSLYSIERLQDVRVLGPDLFRITGRF